MAGHVLDGAAHTSVVGVSRPRIDSGPKVTGAMRYTADVPVPVAGLLHARLVLSLYAHARIDGFDATAALAVPGVVAVLTAGDLPIVGQGDDRMYEPLARSSAVFAGQPVAIVLAETEAAAQDGVDAVIVDYTPLPPVLDPVAAMEPASPLARPGKHAPEKEGASPHAAVGGGEHDKAPEEALSENVIGRHYHRLGDAAAALAASDEIVRGTFTTDWVHQGYLEPQNTVAWFDGDDIVVTTSTQGIFYTRSELAKLYGIPVNRIKVVAGALGGAFGAKLMITEPLAVGAALALRRPVRLTMTRREDFLATNPAQGSRIEVAVGATKDGTFRALTARLVFDAGAFSEGTVESVAAVLIAGPYRWETFDVRAYGVLTNRVGTGSYRGPGAPQASFAIESLVDELAAKLEIDPLELRIRNAVEPADPMIDGRDWPRLGTVECLRAVQNHPLWSGRHRLPPGEGVGLGVGVWPGGRQVAAAFCRLDPDGTISVVTGVVDMSGASSGFATIAAETFGLSPDKVNIVAADTTSAPRSPLSGGSVITYSAGRAIQKAVAEARDQLLAIAAGRMEIAPEDLEIVDGVVRPRGAPGSRTMTVAEIAESIDGFNRDHPPVEGHGRADAPSLAPSVSVHLAHVRVDPDTGEARVLGYVMAQDVGRAINPALIEGQMRGGVVQGIGWALLERLIHDDSGQLVTGSFMDYALPTAAETPAIETIIVEVPAPDGPFGAKGMGEAPVCGGVGAIANAIAQATGGLRMRQMPMTAPRIWAARAEGRAGPTG